MREPSGLIPIINRRAIELLGLPESFLNGPLYGSDILRLQRDSEEFKDPSLPAGVIARLQHGDESNVPTVYERKRPDGTVLEVRSTMLGDGGMVRTYTDITERKRSETALAAARDAAEAASRARSEFLAMMSHEIRTPMNAVLGLTGSLLESNLDADQRKAAEAIQEASDGLLSILNDILDLSKLDTGKLEFEQVAVLDRIRHRQYQEHRGAARRREGAEALARHRSRSAQGADRRSEPRPADPAQPRKQRRQVHAGGQCRDLGALRRARCRTARRCALRSRIPASASRRTGSGACSRISSRPMPRSTGNTAVPASALRSASGWSIRWAATIAVESSPGSGSTFSFQVSLASSPTCPISSSAARPKRRPDSPSSWRGSDARCAC